MDSLSGGLLWRLYLEVKKPGFNVKKGGKAVITASKKYIFELQGEGYTKVDGESEITPHVKVEIELPPHLSTAKVNSDRVRALFEKALEVFQ